MALSVGTESLDAPLEHPREAGEDRTNLIINYLPQVRTALWQSEGISPNLSIIIVQGMTDNELYSMFITSGPIQSAKIMRDKNTGYSFGYGFVHYQVSKRFLKLPAVDDPELLIDLTSSRIPTMQ